MQEKQYTIEYYPKFKPQDKGLLSKDQKKLRAKAKRYIYPNEKKCRTCHKMLNSLKEYYLKDRHTGRRSTKCRDCSMKDNGVISIGKHRYISHLYKKGIRICVVCKEMKPLSEYSNNKGRLGGKAYTCKPCGKEVHDAYWERAKAEISDSYVKALAHEMGLDNISQETIEEHRQRIIANRAPKYFVDGEEFKTRNGFARYLEKEYGISFHQTVKRIESGATEEDCKITESEYRSRAKTKGRILVEDTVTKKKYIFKNTRDERLLKMLSTSAINKGIKTGNPVGGYRGSKWPNRLLLKREPL